MFLNRKLFNTCADGQHDKCPREVVTRPVPAGVMGGATDICICDCHRTFTPAEVEAAIQKVEAEAKELNDRAEANWKDRDYFESNRARSGGLSAAIAIIRDHLKLEKT